MVASKDYLDVFSSIENFGIQSTEPEDETLSYARELAIFSMDIYVALAHLSKLAENILDWQIFNELRLIHQAQQKFVDEIREPKHNQGLFYLVNNDKLAVFDIVVKQEDVTYSVQIREDPKTKKRAMLVFIPDDNVEQGIGTRSAFNTVISIDWRDFVSKEFYLPRIVVWQKQLTSNTTHWELNDRQPVVLNTEEYFDFVSSLTDVVLEVTGEML